MDTQKGKDEQLVAYMYTKKYQQCNHLIAIYLCAPIMSIAVQVVLPSAGNRCGDLQVTVGHYQQSFAWSTNMPDNPVQCRLFSD